MNKVRLSKSNTRTASNRNMLFLFEAVLVTVYSAK